MSEDLDSFFAKRKTKASKKKVIQLDDVAQTLEYNLKFGQDEAEIPTSGKRLNDSDFPIAQDEDSEWIQYNPKPAIPLETVGVFNYNEQVEQEHIAEERQQQAERAKTWQKTEQEPVKEQTPVPTPAPIPEPPKVQTSSAPAPYRPPNARSTAQTVSARRPVHKLDIENEELFPSLEKAELIEKVEKEKEKTRVEEPRQPLKPTPRVSQPQDVRFQNPWGQKETTPEVPIVAESKPVVEEKPAEPRPNVYQPPSGRTGPAVERVHEPEQQSGNKPYLPRFMRGEDDVDADHQRQPPQSRPEGGQGTGMFNARGEEILLSEKPAPVVAQSSWRRNDVAQDQPTEQRDRISAENPRPEPTSWRAAPTDHHQQRPHQPPRNPPTETSNWRNDSNRQAAPRRDHHFEHERPRVENNEGGNWRAGPRRDHQPEQRIERNERPRVEHSEQGGNWRGQPRPQQRHQPAEPKIEHADSDLPPAEESEPNWRAPDKESAPGDDWHVAAGRQRRNPLPSGQQKTGSYIPPNRR